MNIRIENEMRKVPWLMLVLCLVISPGPAQSSPGIQSEKEMNAAAGRVLEQTERLATAIEFAFEHLATFIALSEAPGEIVHAELDATADRIDGLRSILVLSPDGDILWDAYSFPAPKVNLGSRTYFRRGLSANRLQFDEITAGRTSGFPFVPISVFKPSINAVITGILDPRVIQEPLNWCLESCGGALLTDDGRIVTISPVETRLSRSLVDTIMEDHAAGASEGYVHEPRDNFALTVAWRASDKFPFYTIVFQHSAGAISGPID